MIRSYKYIEAEQEKLHGFIITFFEYIKNKTRDFDDKFFDPEFLEIANKHPKLIKNSCKTIYVKFRDKLSGVEKNEFIDNLINSNKIEEICAGNITPLDVDGLPEILKEDIKKLFLDLYTKILSPKDAAFSEKYGTLLTHFKEFKRENGNILCPACGLKEVKTCHNDSRDQYDHYLPKSIYPLSAVNFKNLVPICVECNSLAVKGDKDIIRETTGKLFYPFDEKFTGIKLDVILSENTPDIENVKWKFNFTNDEEKTDEIESWKYIFNIESRYENHVRGRISNWYHSYRDVKSRNPEISDEIYLDILSADTNCGLDYVRTPVLEVFLRDSELIEAEKQASAYSN